MSDALSRREFLAAAAALALVAGCPFAHIPDPAMDRLERLTALFRRRWACPVMAELHRAEGAKFITLVNRLESNPGAVRQTLDTLIELDWVRPNPGYGHPMRPEYILTRRGQRLAPGCAALDDGIRALGVARTALRRWSMPVLYVVGESPRRFNEIARALGGVTDRALALTLRDMDAASLVVRQLIDARPLTSAYAATPEAGPLLPALDRL